MEKSMHPLVRSAVSLSLLTVADGAVAGDYAERNIFGFSPDGAYFAFEEYGTQDGSGFPYANIFLIETATDSWVAGTPIRVLIKRDDVSFRAARVQAYGQADELLDNHGTTEAGYIAASNPVTETSANPHFVSFRPRRLNLTPDNSYDLTLAEYELPAPNCPEIGVGTFKGFRLTLTMPDGTQRVLNQDQSIPVSRRCPLGYGISEVVTYTGGARPVAMVLLNVFSVGFEGPDRRFMAVAAPLP
jgi:predicted secreted protein